MIKQQLEKDRLGHSKSLNYLLPGSPKTKKNLRNKICQPDYYSNVYTRLY